MFTFFIKYIKKKIKNKTKNIYYVVTGVILNEGMGEPFITLIKCCNFVTSSGGINKTFKHSPNHFESKQFFLKKKQRSKTNILN